MGIASDGAMRGIHNGIVEKFRNKAPFVVIFYIRFSLLCTLVAPCESAYKNFILHEDCDKLMLIIHKVK